MQEESIDVMDAVPQHTAPDQETTPSTLLSSASIRAASLAAAAALAACGGDGGDSGGSGAGGAPATQVKGNDVEVVASGYAYLAIAANDPNIDAKISRFLQQAQFAATDEEIAAVKIKGYVKWLEEKMAEDFGLAWEWLNAQTNFKDLVSSSSPLADYVAWNQLLETRNAFRKRAALALSEILVVSVEGLNASWRTHTITHYWDLLCEHAFGNYRDLLEAMTKNIGMGYYLNTKGSRYKLNVQPDENFAREIMQLFTIGLVELNADGTVKAGGGNTYTKDDVSALAHVFTGWDADNSKNGVEGDQAFTRLPMKLDSKYHSKVDLKAFTGKPSGELKLSGTLTGEEKLKSTLDYLFNHPNTAPFICKQLIQRLVTSNPSSAYVERVVKKFLSNNPVDNKKGDLGAVFAAILLDDEARGPAPSGKETEFGKLREPVVRLVQWARTFNVLAPNGIEDLSDPAKELGQSPWRSPSVFNFFRPGYTPPPTTSATKLSTGSVAPEFQIANEISVVGYLNFMMQTVRDGIRGQATMKAAYTKELGLAGNPTALLQRLNILLCGGQLSPGTTTDIKKVLDAITGTDSARMRVCAAVMMVMASADYLIQK